MNELESICEPIVKKIYTNLDADATSVEASINCCMLNGVNNKDFVLVDVTLLSLTIKLYTRQMSVLIPRNTPIPTLKEHICSTAYDNQLTVSYPIRKGERLRHIAKDNNLIRNLHNSYPSATRMELSLQKHSGMLSKGATERMVKEAEKYKAADEE
ncbi:hypothetical protein Cgig2_004775 [Carnegiea gigantea]|uniref:Uncharacterized protein n=1 Tax=Carnegiea gigantea TaxID=171969 RepID=A0A9Q1KWR3_9CARY|nr:hypothetical protein Cgig2_004775 [Carnegiea gigantea]